MIDNAVLPLRTAYAELRQRESFAKLSPQHQIDFLIAALEPTDPERAALMRRWSPAEQSGVLAALARAARLRPQPAGAELWSVTRSSRRLRAVAVQLADGAIDLRLLEADDFWRTCWCPAIGVAQIRADEWRRELLAAGWAQ